MSLTHSFNGKRVLITGGASGIGRSLVQTFHDNGATVLTVDKNAKGIQELKEALPTISAAVTLDLAANWAETERVIAGFGVIDHLVNNAGIIEFEPFQQMTKESIEMIFAVNLFSVINVSQVVSKALITAGRPGTIVNICSTAATTGSLASPAYAASKAALKNLTKSMAADLSQHEIRVNAIAPGAVNTNIIINSAKKATGRLLENLAKTVLESTNRIIEPNEIADTAIFLSGPFSSSIIGETIVVDAGLTLSKI